MQFIFICAMHNHQMICFTSLLWTFFMFIINFHVHLVDLDVHIPRISQSKASSLLESISSFLLLPLILLLLFPFLFYSFLFLFAIQKLFSLMFYLNFCQVFCLFSSLLFFSEVKWIWPFYIWTWITWLWIWIGKFVSLYKYWYFCIYENEIFVNFVYSIINNVIVLNTYININPITIVWIVIKKFVIWIDNMIINLTYCSITSQVIFFWYFVMFFILSDFILFINFLIFTV